MNEPCLYIHIGIHKTGTSAIQDFLALNKKILSQKGFLFPDKSRRDYFQRHNGDFIITPANAARFTKLAELCRNKQKHVILSSETFALIRDVSVLGTALQHCRVKIICYLRRQDNLKQSMYNQSVKTGFFEDITVHEYPLDYYSLLETWSAVFGRHNIIVRIYDKQQLKNGSSIDDFLGIFNLERTEDYRLPRGNANPRLCPEALEYMKLLNRIWKDRDKTEVFSKALREFSVQQRPGSSCALFSPQALLTPAQRAAMLEQYRSSNALVARQYLDRPDGQLFDETLPTAPAVTEAGKEILNEEAMRQMTEYLWHRRKTRKALIRTESLVLTDADQQTEAAQQQIAAAIKQVRQRGPK